VADMIEETMDSDEVKTAPKGIEVNDIRMFQNVKLHFVSVIHSEGVQLNHLLK
jgi:hypothetical protein